MRLPRRDHNAVVLALLATISLLIGLSITPAEVAAGNVKAFPGAEGFGTDTAGGRGGRVIEVTNLNDSGTGSLRAALTASGPRIVVFKVGGTIQLQSVIKVKTPYLTIAGQTAPGDGILIRNAPGRTGDAATLRIQTNDVIMRGMRIRSGAGVMGTHGDSLTLEGSTSSGTHARNIVIDHNSFSWATDETVSSYYDTSDITFSYNIMAEGLSNSSHELGEHSKGLFISGDLSYNISAHHNLMAHNVERNPEVSTNGYSDIRNNVTYDWGKWATTVTDKRQGKTNVVNNVFKPGPSQSTTREDIDLYSYGLGMQTYVAGNMRVNGVPASVDSMFAKFQQPAPLPAAPVTTTSALQAFDDVMGSAGATVPRLDPVDIRILAEVQNGTGRAIDDPSQVGGWPTMTAGTAPVDSDHDGMPDAWETVRGLNPLTNDSAADRDGDGYTNVEEYINGLFMPDVWPTTTPPTPTPTETTSTPATTETTPPTPTPTETTPTSTPTPTPTSTTPTSTRKPHPPKPHGLSDVRPVWSLNALHFLRGR